MTTINAGSIRYNSAGFWSSSTAYAVDDVITYHNKNYICKVAHTNVSPDNTTYWENIGGGSYYRGDWTSATTYYAGDIVNYERTLEYNDHYNYKERATYIALRTTVNDNPVTSTSDWKKIAGGNHKKKFLFLSGFNEGYTPGYKSTWDSYAMATGSTLVGMGDSFGTFKTRGTHHSREGGYGYVNRNYGITVWGRNEYGARASTPNDSGITQPHQVSFTHLSYFDGSLPTTDGSAPKVIQVEAYSGGNMLVLFDNGEVHYGGYNGNGNAGFGETGDPYRMRYQVGYGNINRSGATNVFRDKKAIRIASTSGGDGNVSVTNYALIRDSNDNRTLYTWGYNGYGQQGQGDTTARSVPTTVPFDQTTHGKIIEIWATGGDYGQFFLLTAQGKMFACGYNGNYNLGVGDSTNRSSLTLVKNWGTGTNSIKKFNTAGGGSATSFLVVRRNGTLWTWGYNGYGQLGHNHTYSCALPVQVYTGGYSGASNPVTSSANQGTAVGTGFTDCVDAWMMGGNGYQYMYVTRGSSKTSNTTYSCGYNGYYNLSVSQNNTTNYYTLQTTRYNNNSTLTNVVDVTANQGHSSSYMSHAIKRSNNEWYVGGYNNGWMSIGHRDSYNIRQQQDPTYTASNYRNKNNVLYPKYSDNWYPTVMGDSSNKHCMWVDLNDGEVYYANHSNGYYVNHPWSGSAAPIMHKHRSIG